MNWHPKILTGNRFAFRYMDKRMLLKLNGGRAVSGILRGFDPFMNVVLDETVEECKDNTHNNIGMVVNIASDPFNFLSLSIGNTGVLASFSDARMDTSLAGDTRQQHCDGRGSRPDLATAQAYPISEGI